MQPLSLSANPAGASCAELHRQRWQLLSAGVLPDLPAERRRRRAPEQLQAHQLSRRAWNAGRSSQRFLVRRLLSIWPDELHVRAAERHFDGPAEKSVNVVDERRSDDGSVVPVGTPGSVIECRSVLDRSDPSCVPFNYFGTPTAEAALYNQVTGVLQGETSEQIADVNFTGQLGELGMQTPWATTASASTLAGNIAANSSS